MSRIDKIAQNGNDGLHYEELDMKRCSGCVSTCEPCKSEDLEWGVDPFLSGDDKFVSHPKHYTSDPSGIEVIQMTEHMGFCLGNAIKYIKRCELKGNKEQDLKKAIWYIERELQKSTT